MTNSHEIKLIFDWEVKTGFKFELYSYFKDMLKHKLTFVFDFFRIYSEDDTWM